MLNVPAGTMIVAAVCSCLGVFLVLRRAVFVGAALAKVSSLGVALALFVSGLVEASWGLGTHLPPQPVALALTAAAAVVIAVQHKEGAVSRETLIGVAYTAASGLAILVLAVSSHAESEVLNLMFGNVLAMDTAEVLQLALLGLIVGVVPRDGRGDPAPSCINSALREPIALA